MVYINLGIIPTHTSAKYGNRYSQTIDIYRAYQNSDENSDKSPVGGRPPSVGNGTPRVSGYSEHSDPKTKDRQAAEEGQTSPPQVADDR